MAVGGRDLPLVGARRPGRPGDRKGERGHGRSDSHRTLRVLEGWVNGLRRENRYASSSGRVTARPVMSEVIPDPGNGLLQALIESIAWLPPPERLGQGRAGEEAFDFAG